MDAACPVDAALIAFLGEQGHASLVRGDRAGQRAAMEAAIAAWLGKGPIATACELDRERARRLLPALPRAIWVSTERASPKISRAS